MKKAELMFIPFQAVGHIVSMIEIAKLLTHRYSHLSITFLIIKPFSASAADAHIEESLRAASAATAAAIKYLILPPPESTPDTDSVSLLTFFDLYVAAHIPSVRAAVADLSSSLNSVPVAGFVLDMFCTAMMDLAGELGVPSYVFIPSGAAFLGLLLHFQALRDDHGVDVTEFHDSDAELAVPCFVNPVPARVLPSVVVEKERGSTSILNATRRFKGSNGILINTFVALEPHAVNALKSGTIEIPPVYPVGPILNLPNDAQEQESSIISWLDDKPPSSVVFLCFGSFGSFNPDQVGEIAHGLERSGQRFLWSLRKPPPPKSRLVFPTDYANPEEVLPSGFLERTTGIGKVIGWAPQLAVLAHKAVGGFVSHCGWNSTLESMWCGVPIAAWPMYAEQQLNAFEMVRELGIGKDIRIDYKLDGGGLVSAEEIERGIKDVMGGESDMIRTNVMEIKEKAREALSEGGSSSISLGHFVEQVLHNMEFENS